MAPIIDRIISLFATPQGNLIVFLVLVLFSFGAFQACSYGTGPQASMDGKRMRRGLLSLLLAQLLLFLAAWLAWLGVIEEHAFLPLLDRIVALFSLVLIIWLWVYPKRTPIVDKIVLILEAGILLAGVISLIWWIRQNSTEFFNSSFLGAYAYYAGIALLISGVILLFWRRPNSWGLGVTMLVILLAGYLAQYLIRQPAGDYAWIVRLGAMVGYVLLLELPRRTVPATDASLIAKGEKSLPALVSRMDKQIIQAIINLNNEKSPQKFFQKLTQLVTQMMEAETCLLVMPPKTGGQLIVLVGYSLKDERVIDGFTADGQKMPLLLEAVQSGKTLRIDGSSSDSEVQTLISELGLNQIAHLLAVPFKPKGVINTLSILVLSNPSYPLWSETDSSQLIEIANELAVMFPQPVNNANQGEAQVEPVETLQSVQVELENQRQEFLKLKVKYDDMVSHAAGAVIGLGASAAIVENQSSLEETVSRLEARNYELEILIAKGRPSIEEVEQLRQELRAALTDLARIPSTLSISDQRMLEYQLSTMKRLDDLGQTELVTSIAQEFRQPLSAIIGYTDLLLGESVGLLGAVQRKFLERVKASTERLGILINELVQVLTIDSGKVDKTLTQVDLEAIIDEAVGNIIAQISEKNITMRVDLPEKLPEIRANKEAMQQILANLLENACIVTPEDGEIRLFARIERKDIEPNLLQVSVTDQGGGIDKADIPRVFTRRYKVENPLIQGIGDTGVGLSIVKSLVELQKGRIWVDTQEGIGSIFSVLIPLIEDQPDGVTPSIP
jgi:signal transduction histidine kinase